VPLLAEMGEKMEAFAVRAKRLPTRLRDWEAFKQLRQKIEDYQALLPLLQARSWGGVVGAWVGGVDRSVFCL
jgi:hypothetical protein